MKIRTLLWSGLSASAALLVAGVAFSGDHASTSSNRLIDYDRATRELSAERDGKTLMVYLHRNETRHLLADLSRFAPPDPCFRLADTWNETVKFDEHFHRNSTDAFDVLLILMSDFSCRANVTSTVGTPEPMVDIRPTAD